MTMTFTGTLTHADSKKHIEHRFTVPNAATQLSIKLDHAPDWATGADYANQVSLSLFDPDGARGTRHNNRDQSIRLTRWHATPGYLPGELQAGEWVVVIDTHRIMPPDPLEYTITVDISTDSADVGEQHTYMPGTTASRGPGWYRGDLHGHTLHSDGRWDVPEYVAFAKERGLDFVTLTDHNTVSGLAQLDSLRDDDLLTMGGEELTTYYGHALALGTRQWQEWRTANGRTMLDLARAIMEKGLLFVIAHPRSVGDPACTGCRWEFDDMMPGNAPAVEIWNGVWDDYNEDGLQLYYQWLNAGHRLVATSGTDIHGRPSGEVSGAAVDVVYAEDLTEAAIIDGIQRGHLYLSSGPTLNLTAAQGDIIAMMGDTLPNKQDTEITLTWASTHTDDTARFIVDGRVQDTIATDDAGNNVWLVPAGDASWVLAEVRGADGRMRAVTNPIFFA